ncbi:gastrin-releasing peptide receptor-like [Saccoglossus kowalevskii]|uniref:Gastrin-releasing peptide receptor-like n=1 Tax=Saccoglossus kowalevskii TaxID=10224 RepID=A0ABM0MJM1_SACKO|nr:PREDICTED: gastrin-releasing peptide receptor-like [Saccoglossus kowalevskii]
MAELDPDMYPNLNDIWPSDKPDEDEGAPSTKTVSIILLYLVVFIIGVTGNVLVTAVVAVNEHMRSVTNMFISQIALGDIIMLLLAMPFDIIGNYVYEDWSFGAALCKTIMFSKDYALAVSIITLTAMTIDRFLTLSRSMRKYSIRTMKKFFTVAVIIQLLSLSVAIPSTVFSDVWHNFTPNGQSNDSAANTSTRICKLNTRSSSLLLISLSRVFLFYVLPLAIIGVSFTKINAFLRSTEAQVLLSSNEKIMAACKRALKLLLILVGLYSALLLPTVIDTIISLAISDESLYHNKWFSLFEFLADTALYAICIYKPVVYSIMNANFRRGFRELICCVKGSSGINTLDTHDDTSTLDTNDIWFNSDFSESSVQYDVGDRV